MIKKKEFYARADRMCSDFAMGRARRYDLWRELEALCILTGYEAIADGNIESPACTVTVRGINKETICFRWPIDDVLRDLIEEHAYA